MILRSLSSCVIRCVLVPIISFLLVVQENLSFKINGFITGNGYVIKSL